MVTPFYYSLLALDKCQPFVPLGHELVKPIIHPAEIGIRPIGVKSTVTIGQKPNSIICLFARSSGDEFGQREGGIYIPLARAGLRRVLQKLTRLRMRQRYGIMDHLFPSPLSGASSRRMHTRTYNT